MSGKTIKLSPGDIEYIKRLDLSKRPFYKDNNGNLLYEYSHSQTNSIYDTFEGN